MLKYTLKEYKEEFDKKLSEYLLRFEDNTPVSFIDEQKGLFSTYNNALLLIADKLKEYGDLEAANTIFLPNTIFDGLKKISRETYDDIKIEEKLKPKIMGFQTLEEYLENRDTSSENYCTRIDYTKLRNHLTSVNKILKFITNQYLKYQIETSIESENDSTFSVETEEIEIKTKVDWDQQIIDEHLGPFESYLPGSDYKVLSNSLIQYFKTGKFPTLNKPICFEPMNKKWIGWALKEIHKRCTRKKFSIDLLIFAKQNINLFKAEIIKNEDFRNSKFYRSFTEKPKSYKYRQIHLKYLENH
jgi:hypothetical protein